MVCVTTHLSRDVPCRWRVRQRVRTGSVVLSRNGMIGRNLVDSSGGQHSSNFFCWNPDFTFVLRGKIHLLGDWWSMSKRRGHSGSRSFSFRCLTKSHIQCIFAPKAGLFEMSWWPRSASWGPAKRMDIRRSDPHK